VSLFLFGRCWINGARRACGAHGDGSWGEETTFIGGSRCGVEPNIIGRRGRASVATNGCSRAQSVESHLIIFLIISTHGHHSGPHCLSSLFS